MPPGTCELEAADFNLFDIVSHGDGTHLIRSFPPARVLDEVLEPSAGLRTRAERQDRRTPVAPNLPPPLRMAQEEEVFEPKPHVRRQQPLWHGLGLGRLVKEAAFLISFRLGVEDVVQTN